MRVDGNLQKSRRLFVRRINDAVVNNGYSCCFVLHQSTFSNFFAPGFSTKIPFVRRTYESHACLERSEAFVDLATYGYH